MNILFTICARAGSKGIKGKNVKPFLEYPLSYYTLSALELYCERNLVSCDVIINTDSEELMEQTRRNPFVKAEIIKRVPELSGDRVPKLAVVRDCLDRMEERKCKTYEMVVDMDITSPLRKVKDIEALIAKKTETDCDVVFSVTEARRNPYFNMVMPTDHGYRKVLESNFIARQQAPLMYDLNASLYAYTPDFLRTGKGVLDGHGEIIVMEDTGVLDLDHKNDFSLMQVIARYLYDNDEDYGEVYRNLCLKVNRE